MVIPIYSFLDQLISNIKKYINSKAEIYDHAHRVTVDVNNWAEFLLGSYTYKNFNSIYCKYWLTKSVGKSIVKIHLSFN